MVNSFLKWTMISDSILRVMSRKNLFEKHVSFGPSTKSSPRSYSHPRIRHEESNQPLDYSLTRDDNVPLGVYLHDNR